MILSCDREIDTLKNLKVDGNDRKYGLGRTEGF